jgi:hypothetical protein
MYGFAHLRIKFVKPYISKMCQKVKTYLSANIYHFLFDSY